MAFNVQGSPQGGPAQVALTVFGGLVTDTAASNLPEGVSPDCVDQQFGPGYTGSRPVLSKVFGSSFGSVGVTYGKSYVDPTGVIRNLYLDSSGVLRVEPVSTSPGTYSTLATLPTKGTLAKSITAFGREYIAISDGYAGQEVPLQYDGTNLDRVTQDGPGAPPNVANTIIPATAITGSVRSSNTVTQTTGTAHGLSVGYLAQIGNIPPTTVGTAITSIVIDNVDMPGVATITTSSAHGLAPENFVTLSGISNVVVGTGISAISRQGQVVTCQTSSPHNLSIGALVTIDLVTDSTFNASFVVQQVLDTMAFTYIQADTDATSSGGVVRLNWPFPATETPSFFEVTACPSTTSFQVAISYGDGTWTNGSVSFSWSGTFYVASVPSATTFTYKQYGPDATDSSGSGTCTPTGQISPGVHQVQVAFLTRQDYITRPSPPLSFIANGGQYLTVSNIPIGPSNVVARILMFTGADGQQFFYIPVPGQVNGQQVSTATQINDNTTTSIVIDFGDVTLFSSIGINTPGNNLPAQIILDSALDFAFYNSRLVALGMRNTVQNFLNLGFDGGWLSGTPTVPLGWNGGSDGALTTGHFGKGWQTGTNPLTQSAYLDAYGAPILTPNTKYTARAWLSGSGSVTVTISSVTSAFTATATLTASAEAWVQADFSAVMPASIPTDMIIGITGTGVVVDEISIIYQDTPFIDRALYGSYTDNPEAFDGVSGKFGPSEDQRKVMGCGIIRETLYLLTEDPSGRLHACPANGVTEPVGWQVSEIAADCGLLSIFGITQSQADDATAGGGEEWFAWASSSGARIFSGDQPWKISQEIQPNWTGGRYVFQQPLTSGFISYAGINFANGAPHLIWALNDPATRRIYFGIPTTDFPIRETADGTGVTQVLQLDYKELETAAQIAQSQPIRIGYSGKLVATDHARKWCPWTLSMNGAALMYRSAGSGSNAVGDLTACFFGGNGVKPNGSSTGVYGNIYTLSGAGYTDDDYGQLAPYYITYAFANQDTEAALQLGAQRKSIQFIQFDISGCGHFDLTIFCDTGANPWPIVGERNLSIFPKFDVETPGYNAVAQRFFLKIASFPGKI